MTDGHLPTQSDENCIFAAAIDEKMEIMKNNGMEDVCCLK